MEELILKFREWDSEWWKYDQFPNNTLKPKSVEDFIEELNTKYKVIKLEE